jgi:ferredoxin
MSVAALACSGCCDSEGVLIPRDLDEVIYVDDLCHQPGDLSRSIAGATRLVMIVHPAALSTAKVQRSVRRAGIDPLGIQYLSADTIDGDASRAALLIPGASARAEAYIESRPEHARPRFGARRSRRDLLSVPVPYYEAIPLVDDDVCAAADGCSACVGECPQEAYQWSLGHIKFDRDACVTCGRCITACPTGAIGNPSITSQALTDQIAALVTSTASDSLGIAFVCRQGTHSVTKAGWAEVEVPCAGMVPATWPVAALMSGAAGAAVIPCSVSGCALGSDQRVVAAVTLAQRLLANAGLDPAAVVDEPGPLATPLEPIALDDPFGTHGPTEVALALQSMATSSRAIAEAGLMAFRGLVAIDRDVCTVCLTCTETCPTGALRSNASSGTLAVMFDPSTCTGCRQCVVACPEFERDAIRVDHCIDTAALRAGPQKLAESTTAECELCGGPIAPAAMLDRISQLLGTEHGAAMSYLERRCMDCRGAR